MDYYHYIVSNQWPPFRPDIHKRRASSAPCLTMARTSSRSSSPDPLASVPPSSPSGSFRSIKPLPPLGETLRIVPFVSLCAMVGVLTRIGLDELFGPNVLDVTSTESATFPDWFPNAWGSFVMGFFVPMRQSPFFARCALFLLARAKRRGAEMAVCCCAHCTSLRMVGQAPMAVRGTDHRLLWMHHDILLVEPRCRSVRR